MVRNLWWVYLLASVILALPAIFIACSSSGDDDDSSGGDDAGGDDDVAPCDYGPDEAGWESNCETIFASLVQDCSYQDETEQCKAAYCDTDYNCTMGCYDNSDTCDAFDTCLSDTCGISQ